LHASCEVLPRRTKLEAPNRSCNMALGIYNAEAMSSQRQLSSLIRAGFGILLECGTFLRSSVRSRSSLIAENLFLRKQLAFYKEHQVRPRRLTDSARISLVLWSKLCDWRSALVIVKPETLISWHRRGFKLFWQLKSRVGRPRLPSDIRQLIARMVEENPTWGQARVADELALKLGILVSPRTVRAYWPKQPDRRGPRPTCSQPWQTFVRNHAQSLLACDFLVVVTARFRLLYVFVLMEIDTRKILQCKVTAHPAAAWTLQQFREALPRGLQRLESERPQLRIHLSRKDRVTIMDQQLVFVIAVMEKTLRLSQHVCKTTKVTTCGAQKLHRTRIYALEGRVRRNKNVLQVSIRQKSSSLSHQFLDHNPF
jgi:Homeodomain-like domain